MTDSAPGLSATGTVKAEARPYFVDRDWSVALVARLFNDIRGVSTTPDRFQWLYLDNPAGVAEVWILREEGGETVEARPVAHRRGDRDHRHGKPAAGMVPTRSAVGEDRDMKCSTALIHG